MIDLVRELDFPSRREPELEVEIEMFDARAIDDMLLDPWFQRSEAEIAMLADDPDAHIHEICLAARSEAFDLI